MKGLARRTPPLDREFVKSYLPNEELSENRKAKVLRRFTLLRLPGKLRSAVREG